MMVIVDIWSHGWRPTMGNRMTEWRVVVVLDQCNDCYMGTMMLTPWAWRPFP